MRRIEAAREIAATLARSRNRVFLDADTLMLNITQKLDENLNKSNSLSALEKQAQKWHILRVINDNNDK